MAPSPVVSDPRPGSWSLKHRRFWSVARRLVPSRPPRRLLRRVAPWLSVALSSIALGGCARCSSESAPAPDATSPAPPEVRSPLPLPSRPTPEQLLRDRAREIAGKLGRKHFLIGLGNDLDEDHDKDGAYTLGPPLDLHYAYLVGLQGRQGWPDWIPNGGFVDVLATTAQRHGVVPMFTLYSMAASGEGKGSVLTDTEYMSAYWAGARLLFQRLGHFDAPALVHFEPDFWGFMQQAEPEPRDHTAQVERHAPECQGLGDSVAGLGRCLVRLARKYAPKTLVGFHASAWAHKETRMVADYLVDVGAREADFLVVETLDRDAGCFEAAIDPNCQRRDGPWYWDETNQRSPNFHEHLAWARALAERVQRPLLWWQMPLGVPSDQPGGAPGRYRDNRVKYLFEHVDEFVAAGGFGAAFGVGAANQTYITTDGGQFKRAVEAYRAQPFPL